MKRRPPVALLVSIALHVVLGAALIQVVLMPLPLAEWFRRARVSSLPVERIAFITLPRSAGPTNPGRSGGDGRAPSTRPLPPPPAAPATVPTGVTPVPAAPAPPEPGSGEVIGSGGPTRGIRPSFSDPRIWLPPGPVVSAPTTATERLDSAFGARLRAHVDSLAALAATQGRGAGDWTFTKGGKKYGIDPQYIHLGDVKLPTAVLAMLPFNRQGNIMAIQNERRIDQMHGDIMEQAQRAYTEDEFRSAVRAIRERKERERKSGESGGRDGDGAPRGAGPGSPDR